MTHCVIREPYRHFEFAAQKCEVGQLRILQVGRIRRHTMQQQEFVAMPLDQIDSRLNLLQNAHAGRQDDRPAGLCGIGDERQINKFRRPDFQRLRIKRDQKVNSSLVKRRAEKRNTDMLGMGKNLLVPLVRRLSLFVEVVKPAPFQMPSVTRKSSRSLSSVMVSAVYVWIFTASHPASLPSPYPTNVAQTRHDWPISQPQFAGGWLPQDRKWIENMVACQSRKKFNAIYVS